MGPNAHPSIYPLLGRGAGTDRRFGRAVLFHFSTSGILFVPFFYGCLARWGPVRGGRYPVVGGHLSSEISRPVFARVASSHGRDHRLDSAVLASCTETGLGGRVSCFKVTFVCPLLYPLGPRPPSAPIPISIQYHHGITAATPSLWPLPRRLPRPPPRARAAAAPRGCTGP